MSALKRGLYGELFRVYEGLYKGLQKGLLRGMLGVEVSRVDLKLSSNYYYDENYCS